MSRQQYIQQLSNVPIELRELNQWVVHVNKVPHCARTRGKAQANNLATWTSFEFACHVFEKGFGDGLSFAFSEYDPYCGVDFDKCVADGKTDDHKRTIICGLNSYSELSTSGSGIHVFVKATLESGRKSTKYGIEVYDRSRFFAMTGRRLAVSHKIEERQEKIDELIEKYFPKPVEIQAAPTHTPTESDQEIIERMCNENYKAARLWRGDFSHIPRKETGAPDMSSADLSLLNIIARFAGNDIATMERVFRSWQFFRPQKWYRRARGNMTYGQLTLTKAMSGAARGNYGK